MSRSWSILPQTQNLTRLIRRVLGPTIGKPEQNSGQASDVKVLFEQLAEAAKAGQQEIFQVLVAAEQQEPDEEATLLIAAVMENQLEVVNTLITAGSDVNMRIKLTDGQFEFTALYYAVRNASLPIVETLLRAGADPKWSDSFPSFAPIFHAIEQNNTALVQVLIQYGATVVFRSKLKPLVNAAESDNPEIIRLLLDAGCDIDARYAGDSALKKACQYGNLKVIQLLLESGASLSSSGDEIGTVFLSPEYVESRTECSEQKAKAIEKIPAAIQLLLGAGVDPNVKTWNGTPLILAIAHGYAEVVRNLLAAGADPNLQSRFDYEETIPLHHAAKLGQRDMVQTLIEAGADIAATDRNDKTATAIAVYEGYQDIVDLLKKAGASSEPNYTEQSDDALMGAAKRGNVQVLQAALEAGVDPNLSVPLTGRQRRRRRSVLMFAAQDGHLDAVQCLVAGGANVNLSDRPGKRFGRTPLMYAASHGHGDVVRFLLESGAVVDAQDKRGQTALFYAVEEDSAAAVQVLLEFGADPHKQSWEGTPFKWSEYAGYEVRELFAQEAVKNTDPEDKTALEAALRSATLNGYIDITQNLIRQGIDVNSTQFNTEEDYIDIPVDKNTTLMYRTNQDGWTPLFASVIYGHLEIVELLLSNGADVGIATILGKTPLSEAVYWGHEAIVRRLLSAGADINQIDQDQGLTPLMNTVDFERVEILKILLDAGADVTIRNKTSRTVFELALKENKQAILDVLHQFGVTA